MRMKSTKALGKNQEPSFLYDSQNENEARDSQNANPRRYQVSAKYFCHLPPVRSILILRILAATIRKMRMRRHDSQNAYITAQRLAFKKYT